MLFHPGSHPRSPFGHGRFLWKPLEKSSDRLEEEEDDQTDSRTLWLWVHPGKKRSGKKSNEGNVIDLSFFSFPGFASDLVETMTSMFQSVPFQGEDEEEKLLNGDDDEPKPPASKKPKLVKDVNSQKLEPRNVPFVKVPKFKNEFRSVTLRLLKDTLNRFRLIGPEAGQILAKTLRLASIGGDGRKWWQQQQTPNSLSAFEAQSSFWSDAGRTPPGDIPMPGFALGLTVRDPRVFLPRKKESVPDIEEGKRK